MIDAESMRRPVTWSMSSGDNHLEVDFDDIARRRRLWPAARRPRGRCAAFPAREVTIPRFTLGLGWLCIWCFKGRAGVTARQHPARSPAGGSSGPMGSAQRTPKFPEGFKPVVNITASIRTERADVTVRSLSQDSLQVWLIHFTSVSAR